MAYIQINAANIYYEVYGEDHPGLAPIVLVHGSTIDGFTDWQKMAPRLAEKYRVLVPDCRGHGKSNNPGHSYSFRELANDVAAFIRAMGYERAHVIGHSNGGNIALVTVVEHPDVVQTAIPQAANAFVTDYLREREPVVLAPDYYAEHNPGAVEEMIAIHGALHGRDYWRELLHMTMLEIISEPNYTPEILAQVKRPVLSIMGANDKVNAPDRHAQFIAENIPGAELWVPDGVGHNVHWDLPEEWLQKVLDFLDRRGNE